MFFLFVFFGHSTHLWLRCSFLSYMENDAAGKQTHLSWTVRCMKALDFFSCYHKHKTKQRENQVFRSNHNYSAMNEMVLLLSPKKYHKEFPGLVWFSVNSFLTFFKVKWEYWSGSVWMKVKCICELLHSRHWSQIWSTV